LFSCITFVNRPDFYTVRSQLLPTKKVKVPGSRTGLMAYGYVDVQGGERLCQVQDSLRMRPYTVSVLSLHGGYQVLVSHSMGHGYRL
jgi:hypothetical protein